MPTPNDLTIVLINLDRDTDRLAHMREQFETLGLAFERFAAVKGADLPGHLRSYFDGVETLSPGEIGCYASHLDLHRRIAAGDIAAPVLVLEDDVRLPDDLPDLIDAVLETLPRDWDIVRLSNFAKRAYAVAGDLGDGRALVRYTIVPGSTGAYLISASGARKFLVPRKRALPVDQDLRRVWTWDLNTFGVAPPPIGADVLGASSIDAMAPAGLRKARGRQAKLRRGRALELPRRMRWNLRTLGIWRWLTAELTNIVVSVAPWRRRQTLLKRVANWIEL